MKTPYEMKVICMRECPTTETLIDTAERAAAYWTQNIETAQWFDPDKEAMVVLMLNTRRQIICHNLVSLGQLDACLAHPREVFRPAICVAASAIIMIHNHPSGESSPSEADLKNTRDMIRAGQLLKIDVVDHVIMGKANDAGRCGWASLRELGYFYQS